MVAVKEKFRSNMNITRIDKKEGNYTRVSNDLINDSRLSLKEKGIMIHILSKPDNWILNVKEIANSNQDGEKAVYSGIKKLKELGYINLKPVYGLDKKITSWIYYINESPSVTIVNKESELLTQKVQVGNLQVGIRQYNNTNSNNTKVSKKDKEETYQLSEIENVENSVIEFADKVDEDKIKNEFDNLLDGRLQIQANLIDPFKRKASEFRKVRPLTETLELIKLLPDFVKASRSKNPDKVYEDRQALIYLEMIIKNPLGNYPKWFLESQKQSLVNKEVDNLTQSWKPITTIWNTNSFGRIDNCIKAMIEKILTFVTESENNKKSDKKESVFLARFRGVFNEACINTLKVKKLSEMIEIINEYINKEWNKSDTFSEVIENFNKSGSSLETISLYFNQAKAGI